MRGITDNLQTIFGPDMSLYRDMANRTLDRVELSQDKEKLTFHFQEGAPAVFGVEGDCCSQSWIEHLEVPLDIQGAVVTGLLPGDCVEINDPKHECLKVYKTEFVTTKGHVVLEFRNSSNGYYGGYIIRLDGRS